MTKKKMKLEENKGEKYYGKWKKLDIKGHMSYDSTYMKFPEKKIYRERK